MRSEMHVGLLRSLPAKYQMLKCPYERHQSHVCVPARLCRQHRIAFMLRAMHRSFLRIGLGWQHVDKPLMEAPRGPRVTDNLSLVATHMSTSGSGGRRSVGTTSNTKTPTSGPPVISHLGHNLIRNVDASALAPVCRFSALPRASSPHLKRHHRLASLVRVHQLKAVF